MTAVELGLYLEERLKQLPPDHPDRGFFEAQLALTLNYLAGKTSSPEVKLDIARFSYKEKEALLRDGAVIYSLTGETIADQLKIQKMMGKRLFWSICSGGDGLVAQPSRLSEVAVYPDPLKFFVPDTGSKILEAQEKIVVKEAEELRGRLGLPGIDVIIPDAVTTLTELAIKHFILTGVWLFGLPYGITKNSINRSGCVAIVGRASPITGLEVSEMYLSDSRYDVHAVCLVVPRVDR